MPIDTRNNYDLIRLFAALQVLTIHVAEHIGLPGFPDHLFFRILSFIPGVPIFFFVSGYLITASAERSKTLTSFFNNRALRIFPALWACLAVSLILVWSTGYFRTVEFPADGLIGWIVAQTTFVQFFNPDFMRGYGVGVLNGSLWTISVELQFYLLVPFITLLVSKSRGALVASFLFFLAINIWFTQVAKVSDQSETIAAKLFGVTFAPWFAMFLLGAIFHYFSAKLVPVLRGKMAVFACVYAILIAGGILAENTLNLNISRNLITPLHYIPLGFLILSAAYSSPTFSSKILGKNDISYGLYIYHMPIVNFWLYMAFPVGVWGVSAATVTIAALAFLSWKFVERPALGLKRHSIFVR
jgi:peptidoglycan/LPS O-acetylase OafA/YrhL